MNRTIGVANLTVFAALIAIGCHQAGERQFVQDDSMVNASETDLVFNVEGLT